MPLILPARTLDSSYEIENSLRQYGTDQYLGRTPSSEGNRKTWTFSCWFKRSDVGSAMNIWTSGADVSNRCHFDINSSGTFQCEAKNGGSEVLKLENAGGMVLRDPAAWYHLVWRVDTTQSTAGNRVRVYINGNLLTFTGSANYPDQNTDMAVNDDVLHAIGKRTWADENYFSGHISEIHHVDGSSLAPTSFGETNDDGVWVPIDCKGDLTYGTNGFYLEFKETGTSANSSGIGADTSGNDHHWSVYNHSSLHIMPDTPTNNFCVLNTIAKDPHASITAGGLKWTSGGEGGVVGTMAVSNGKWYWECKGVDVGADSQVGIWQTSKDTGYPLNQYVGTGESWGYVTFSGKNIHNDSQSGVITAVSDNDIMMFALDMDNYKLWFGINGTWTQSGNPATGDNANHTGITDEFMTPAIASFSGSSGYDWRFNFGGPNFTVSSGNADGNGYGNFEYAVPSGYYSLCTKNLAEFG